jgi:hypothetical protein
MITVRCIKCKRIIYKYKKIGKGNLWHCWKNRIKQDNSVHCGNEIRCVFGNLIGIEEEKWIKMKQHFFEISGTVTKK